MGNKIQITVLIENTVRLPELKAEHGWSVHIETEYGNLLFDTGQSSQLIENAALLNIDLNRVDKVAISHGHYDHTGGLPELLKRNTEALIYAHSDIFKTRYYKRPGGSPREIGITQKNLDLSRFLFSGEPVRLYPSCITTGVIPIGDNYVTTEGNFYEDVGGDKLDPITDDQALILESEKGLIVILGCCHAGLKASFEQVRRITGESSIYMVMGGMHLIDASEELLKQTIETLREYSVKRIGLGHCTGHHGALILQSAFPDQCFPCNTGLRLKV